MENAITEMAINNMLYRMIGLESFPKNIAFPSPGPIIPVL